MPVIGMLIMFEETSLCVSALELSGRCALQIYLLAYLLTYLKIVYLDSKSDWTQLSPEFISVKGDRIFYVIFVQ